MRDQVSPLPSNHNGNVLPHHEEAVSDNMENEFEEITDEEVERSLGESYSAMNKGVEALKQKLNQQYVLTK